MNSTVFPNATQVSIGNVNQTSTVAGVLRAKAVATVQALIMGLVKNTGLSAMTFSIQQSNDNGATDAWATINVRLNGSAVSSITVQPQGAAAFSVETFTKKYLQVICSPQPGATGSVIFWTPLFNFTQVGLAGYAYDLDPTATLDLDTGA